MNDFVSRRNSNRITLDPPEVGVLYMGEIRNISDLNASPPPKKMFVDLINRSEFGVGLIIEKKIEPASFFYLHAFNKTDQTWDIFEGQSKWIQKDQDNGINYKIGAELSATEIDHGCFADCDTVSKKMPSPSDYQFFRSTDLLKSISRESVCPMLNSITFKYVEAGQRFITQGDFEDTCYIVQKGICVVNVEKDGELIPVARMRAGNVVGEMALITGEPRNAHVDAETDMHLWCLGKDQFDQISMTYPELRSFLTELIANNFETRPLTAERRIGKYVITDFIGKGGYSIVYRGTHEALGMSVAIKMMKHDLAMNSDFIQNFRNEALTIAQFNHENLVHVYDIEERYKTLFIIMEHLEGMSLRTYLKSIIRLPPAQVVDYMLQICAGLQYAHSKNVVHQDIKPGNIFILPNGKIKILDFGLSCPCGSENLFTGTPFYMSPEQIDCLPVDVRTDIFALGLTAYEMLTGHRPFQAENTWEVMDLLLKQDIPDPIEDVPNLPDALRKFVIKACMRDPGQRYQNVEEIMMELQPISGKPGSTQKFKSSESRKMATMFLLYKNEHQPELNRMMQDFCQKVNELGVSCKAADLKEI